jgi:hypothetical protein
LDRALRAAAALSFVLALVWALAWHFKGATRQLLLGDELHAVRVALFYTPSEIWTYYDTSDNSIPYTLYVEWLVAQGWFDETIVRLPVFVSHVGLLCAPLLLARHIGWSAAFATSALLSTSPLIVHYALVARPYTPAAFAMTLATCAWASWVTRPRLWALLAFCFASVLAAFLHLYCLFAVLALLAVGAVGSRFAQYRFRTLFMAGLAIGAALAALYLPGLEGLRVHRLGKVGLGDPAWTTFMRSVHTLTADLRTSLWLLVGGASIGVVSLARRAPLVCAGLCGTVLVQVAALFATRPVGEPNVWARYFMPVLPSLMALMASGLCALPRLLLAARADAPRLRQWVAGALGVALAAASALNVMLHSPQEQYSLGRSSLRTSREFLLCLELQSAPRSRVFQHIHDDPQRGDTLVVYPSFDLSREWGELVRDGLRDTWVLGAAHNLEFLRQRGITYQRVLNIHSNEELQRSGAKYLLTDALTTPPNELRSLLGRLGRPIRRDDHCLLFDLTVLQGLPR